MYRCEMQVQVDKNENDMKILQKTEFEGNPP